MADRTESSTVIAAEPAAVLDVIADFDSYPEWASEFKAGKVKQVAVISAGDEGWADQVEFTLAGATKQTYVLAPAADDEQTRKGRAGCCRATFGSTRAPTESQTVLDL